MDLFDDESVSHLLSLGELEGHAVILFSKLLTRLPVWLRLDVISAYLPSDLDLEDALNELIEKGFLVLFESESNMCFDDVWGACSCLSVDEVKAFSALVTNGPTNGYDYFLLSIIKHSAHIIIYYFYYHYSLRYLPLRITMCYSV